MFRDTKKDKEWKARLPYQNNRVRLVRMQDAGLPGPTPTPQIIFCFKLDPLKKATKWDLLIFVEHTEGIQEGEVGCYTLKVLLGDVSIMVVIVVSKHRLQRIDEHLPWACISQALNLRKTVSGLSIQSKSLESGGGPVNSRLVEHYKMVSGLWSVSRWEFR